MSFFISVDGRCKEGPLSLEAIKLKLLNNEVDESTLLWKQGMSEWRPAGEVAEFKELVNTLPPPLPQKEIMESSFLVTPTGGMSEYSDEFSAKLAILEDHRRGIIDEAERDSMIRKVSDYFSQVQDDERKGIRTVTQNHVVTAAKTELEQVVEPRVTVSKQERDEKLVESTWSGKPKDDRYRVISGTNVVLFVILSFLHQVWSVVNHVYYDFVDMLIFFWIARGLVRWRFLRSHAIREGGVWSKIGITILCWAGAFVIISVWNWVVKLVLQT